MSSVEFIPLNKGNRIHLTDATSILIGRTPDVGCLDNRISRKHAQLLMKSDGTVWIKAIHTNPTFYKTKANQIVRLTKDKEYQLHQDDQFGLLPDEYFFRLTIQPKPDPVVEKLDQEPTVSTSTEPKPSTSSEQPLITTEKRRKDDSESASTDTVATARSLPNWMSDTSSSTPNAEMKPSKEDVPTSTQATHGQPSTPVKRTRVIIYDDDDDDREERSSVIRTHPTAKPSASSSTKSSTKKRERCPFATSCYRTNPIHRHEAIHPGDSDWEDDEEEISTKKKPLCPFGDQCYRKNPDHLQNYDHTGKGSSSAKTTTLRVKRKASDDEDDDDGLPNEYDYNDSFIDDEELNDSIRIDREDDEQSDGDIEWKPSKNRAYLNDTDDDSSEDSELETAKEEAAQFVKGSTADSHGSMRKKRRKDTQDTDDD